MTLKINFAKNYENIQKCRVYTVFQDENLTGLAADFNQENDNFLTDLIEEAEFKGKEGEFFTLRTNIGETKSIVLLGLGKKEGFSEKTAIDLGGQLAQRLTKEKFLEVSLFAENMDVDRQLDLGLGVLLGNYHFDKYFGDKKKPKKLSTFVLHTPDCNAAQDAFNDRNILAESAFFTRDLTSEPANVLYPGSFVERIQELTALGVEVDILNEEDMEKLGMGALLSVGRGSEKESYMAVMKWWGAENGNEAPVAFCGKGVTFDTGGTCLKSAGPMADMKFDMGGAGVVAGLMHNFAKRKAKANIVGLVGLVENMPSGNASRPGDVVTTMSGQTVEILNTDAEGRLVLSDVMHYCQEKYSPQAMVDLATLTGAILVSLGHEFAGAFYNNEELKDKILDVADETGEKAWPMPMTKGFDKAINSKIADMINTSTINPWGSSITAAQFLNRFVKKETPWVHIDMAGTVWQKSDQPRSVKGATGYGVMLLDRLVRKYYEKK